MILADQGAEVVKIEPLTIGDVMRHLGTARGGISAIWAGCNRSKRSVAINLREERGVELLNKLVEDADVFVQNFRPGVADRIGIGEDDLRQINPSLVYVSLSAFGAVGPWANKPAFDHVVQAVAGVASVQADFETGEARFVQNAVIDKVTALTASQAITAALLHRATTGEAQHVQLSMLASALQFIWPDGMAGDALLGDGVNTQPPLAKAYRMIDLKDGHIAVAALTQDQIQGLMRAIGRPDLIEDERFSTLNALVAHLDELKAETEAAASEMTVAETMAAFEAEDVPCAPVLATRDVVDHPQVIAHEIFEEVDHPTMGRMRRPRPAPRFSRTPAAVSRHAPALGEDTAEVLSEVGIHSAELAELRAKGIVG
jgi:crotonobetainyl-CoA:carnitine CoA-transferase CaiB-like acyl-CoA transferase